MSEANDAAVIANNGDQRKHPGPGYWLKQARERRAWTQREAADMLNLSPRFIVAMEDETFDKLPAAAFARGYLRAYAKLLGLVGDEIIRRYESVVGDDSDPYFRELVATRRQPLSGFVRAHPGLVVGTIATLLATVLFGGAWLLWRSGGIERATGDLHIPDTIAGVTGPAATAPALTNAPTAPPIGNSPAAVALPPPASADVVRVGDDESGDNPRGAGVGASLPGASTAPSSSSPAFAPAVDANGASQAVATPQTQDGVAAPVAGVAGAAVAGAAGAGDRVAGAALTAAVPAPGAAATTAAAAGADQLRIALAEDCWVEVRDARGTRLYSGMARRGANLAVSGNAPMTLVLGNAPAARVTFNGGPVDVASHTRERIATLVVHR